MNPGKLLLAFAAVALSSHGWAEGKLRFAQLTDLHLFDAGYNCYEPDYAIERDEAINGLKWAIDKINAENAATSIDFVVITGDFGIANLILGNAKPPHEPPKRNACNPETPKSDDYGPTTPPETIDEAAFNLACIFRELKVRSIYLLPGNNDVPDNQPLGIEDPEERESYQQFVLALSHELPGRIRDLSGLVEPDSGAPPDQLHGYRLIGIDTASFKPSRVEIEKSTPMSPAGNKPTAARIPKTDQPPPPCADPAPDTVTSRARSIQISRAAALAANASGPFLLFTHIPDLPDPFPGRQVNGASDARKACSLPSSWMLGTESKKSWTGIISNPKLVGVFTGHFHAADESKYGGPYAAASASPASAIRNVYVAPPLSLKNQWTTPNPRRGLLVVDVKDDRVKETAVDWYRGIDPTEYKGKETAVLSPAWLTRHELMRNLLAYGVVIILILVWDIVVKR